MGECANKAMKLIEIRNLTRKFKGFVAVDNVDLTVEEGSIHALIGPNGAGKTTLFNLLTGFLTPSSGSVKFRGRELTELSAVEIANSGIVRSFQISAIFPTFTALENVRIALGRRKSKPTDFWRSSRILDEFDECAAELLDKVGLISSQHILAQELAYGQRRALEIATTLAMDPDVFLLDEPTQGMGAEDVARIATLIKRVAAGRTVVMVEHNLSVVADIADYVTVLNQGKVLAEGPYAEVAKRSDVLEAYMGSKAA